MKRIGILAALFLVATTTFAANPPQNASITVNANNSGVFTFTIAAGSFDFGNVDANGTLSSTGVAGARNGGNTGADYIAAAATTWQIASAPSHVGHIFNASTVAGGTFNFPAGNLSIQLPTAGGTHIAVSCGYKAFTNNTDGGANCGNAAAGTLLGTFTAGNGPAANKSSGDLDLKLSVYDTDATGANVWIVTLTATSP
jgi:hypothetical protein